jgi:membrane protein DedA with SNARE-associated domain
MESSSFAAKLLLLLSGLDGSTAYLAILGILFLCGLGLPVPEDITLIAAGVLAAIGSISLTGALVAGFIGVLIGDFLLFFLGRKYGMSVLRLPGFRSLFTPDRISAAERTILRNSRFICFTARFLPGLRAPIYLTAGIMGVRPAVFFGLDALAALISVPFWIFVGHWFGENLDDVLKFAKQAQFTVLGVVILVAVLYLASKWRKKLIAPGKPKQEHRSGVSNGNV